MENGVDTDDTDTHVDIVNCQIRACPEEERIASVSVSLLCFLYTYIYVFVPVPLNI